MFHAVFRDIFSLFFFFNDTATTEIYTLSLHDALPTPRRSSLTAAAHAAGSSAWTLMPVDRKSTRLNSSHVKTSYAVFCLKKKKNISLAPHREVALASTSPPRVNTENT